MTRLIGERKLDPRTESGVAWNLRNDSLWPAPRVCGSPDRLARGPSEQPSCASPGHRVSSGATERGNTANAPSTPPSLRSSRPGAPACATPPIRTPSRPRPWRVAKHAPPEPTHAGCWLMPGLDDGRKNGFRNAARSGLRPRPVFPQGRCPLAASDRNGGAACARGLGEWTANSRVHSGRVLTMDPETRCPRRVHNRRPFMDNACPLLLAHDPRPRRAHRLRVTDTSAPGTSGTPAVRLGRRRDPRRKARRNCPMVTGCSH